MADAVGNAAVDLRVPNHPAITGLELFTQCASSATSNALGFVTSDALRLQFR